MSPCLPAQPGLSRGGKGWEQKQGKGLGAPGRDTWGLEHGGNELRVDEPQDGVEGPNPPEVDVTEVVAQFLHQLQALLICLHLGMSGNEARPGRGLWLPTVPPTHHTPLTPLTPSAWIIGLHLSPSHYVSFCLLASVFSCVYLPMSLPCPLSLFICFFRR